MNRIQQKNLKLSHENQIKKQSIHKTDKIKCSNRYGTLYTDDNDDESCNSYDSSTSSDGSPHLTEFLTKSHRVIFKRKKIEKSQ